MFLSFRQFLDEEWHEMWDPSAEEYDTLLRQGAPGRGGRARGRTRPLQEVAPTPEEVAPSQRGRRRSRILTPSISEVPVAIMPTNCYHYYYS